MTSPAPSQGHGLAALGPRHTGTCHTVALAIVSTLVMGALVVAALSVSGCGPRDTRVRHRVSGKITYGGKPVPGGEIILTPDGAKKNTGAQGIATIKDGTYDTQGSRAPGVGGGPMSAMVMGLLEADGSRFFEHTLPIDCSTSGDTVFDIEIAPGDAPERKQAPI